MLNKLYNSATQLNSGFCSIVMQILFTLVLAEKWLLVTAANRSSSVLNLSSTVSIGAIIVQMNAKRRVLSSKVTST